MDDNTCHFIHATVTSVIILILAYLFYSFSDRTIIELVTYMAQLPLFLVFRSFSKAPLHAKGLVKCTFYTVGFIILLFILLKLNFMFLNNIEAIVVNFCILGLMTTILSETNKKFLGERKDTSTKKKKMKQIYIWVRRNKNDKRLVDFEYYIRDDDILNVIYQEIFLLGTEWSEVADILDLEYTNYLTKYVYQVIGAMSRTIHEIKEMAIDLNN